MMRTISGWPARCEAARQRRGRCAQYHARPAGLGSRFLKRNMTIERAFGIVKSSCGPQFPCPGRLAARCALVITLICLRAPALVGQQANGDASCRRSPGKAALQIGAGVLGAWIGGMGSWAAIDDIDAPDRRVKGDAGYQPNANTAYAIGSWAGSTLGVYGAGRLLKPRCGSLIATAVGAGLPSLFLAFGRHEPYLPIIGVIVAAPFQAIGGAVAWNRKW